LKNLNRKNHHALLLGVLILSGCGTNPVIKESQALLNAGRFEESVFRLAEGMRDSSDPELRSTYFFGSEIE
jgi:hypothetical protein